MKIKTLCFVGIITLVLYFPESTHAQWGSGYDDPFTSGINEGAIGSGYDDPFTSDINEGAIGSGYGMKSNPW